MSTFDINGLEFKVTRKKQYDVYVCKPKLGYKVKNILEGSEYVTSQERQFVISGTVGETWVVDINKLTDTYCFLDERPITQEELVSRLKGDLIDWIHIKTKAVSEKIYFAAHLSINKIKNYTVKTSCGDTLLANRPGVPHGQGDYIVCSSVNGQPNLNDMWVVNGKVFETTYDMGSFAKDIKTSAKSNTHKETPVPKSILP